METRDRHANARTMRRAGRWLRRGLAVASLAAVALAHAADLTVSAAASLLNAFKDIGPMFEAANPGTRLLINFGASGALLQQIAKGGAPVDVFVSADEETMDQAERLKVVDFAHRRDVASNALVVIVPASAGSAPRTLADLVGSAYQRIAIGLPASVPAGRYTRSALEQAGLWPAIEARMVGATNVRQVLDYVARAEVDAGFVYATDAALMRDKVKVAFAVPTRNAVRYPAAPVAASANPTLAIRFVEFLQSSPAQAVLARHGFGKP
ncbi:MAG TPA: molybdate ABC transporter substrate-binding protein [Caldimonas sp.]|nr:molybdate ABC transporter substrate-binding protein [Caldimonas sp.]